MNYIYCSKIYNKIIFINLIAAISYCIVGYFSIITSESGANYEFHLSNSLIVIYFNILISTFLFLIIIFNNLKIIRFKKLFLLSIFYLFISIVINNKIPSINMLYSILLIYGIFFLPKMMAINIYLYKKFYFVILIFCITPIFLYLIEEMILMDTFQIPPLIMFGSFRGFSFDRIEYSLMLGYCLILLICNKKYFSIPIFLIACYGLIISESRAALLSLWVSTSFIFYRKKYWVLINLFFLICGVFLIFSGSRSDDLLHSGDREVLYLNSLAYIFSNPFQMLFGSGSLYTAPPDGVVPHNSILQTILNFGFTGLIIWFLLIKNFYLNLNRVGKGFLIYINFFGLMHPGFDGFYFLPTVALGYFIALGISNSVADLKYG